MLTQEQILAGLKKIGPCAPAALATHLQVEAPALAYHLKKMLDAGTVKATGAATARRIALPDQEFDSAESPTPPQRRRQRKARKPKSARKAKQHRKPHRAKPAPAARPAERFIPAVDADSRLIIVNGSEQPLHFSEAQTTAIAELLFQHYDKG